MSRFVLNRLIWRFSRVTRRILRYVLTLNFKKIVAFITLSCFLFTFVLAQSLQAAVNKIEENMKLEEIGGDFFLPYSIGHITDAKYFAESDKVVINIQDLHCHPEVQLNISKAIAILDEKYGLKKVFVEGAIGEVDTSWLASIKDKEFKQKLVDLLINQGKLTGAEHYSISSGKPGLLAGLEDERIYKENIIRLDSILNESPWIELILYNMQKEVDDLKDRYYDSKHKGFEKLVSSYRNGGVEAGGFYRKLNGYTEKLDINLENYRNISLYLKMVRLRKNLNHNKINRELYGLIEVLKEKLPYKVYKSLDDSLKKYSEPDDVYLYIDRIIHEFDLKIETKFPNLKEFLEYVKLSQEVNPIELVSEENILLQKINIKLSKSQAEKEVVILDGLFKYYSSYYTNKISNKEYEYFREHSDDFKALWRRYIGVGSISQFERISDLFDEFYRANIARNDCFLSNCLGKCEEIAPCNVFTSSYDNQREKAIESLGDTDEIVVIVTGGFHTPGLAQRLEDRRISYVIITPNVTKDAGFSESVYKKDTRIQAKMLGSSLALLNLSENPISYKLWSIAEAELTNLVSQGLSPEVIVERMEALFENYADELKQQSGVKVGKVNISYTDNHFIFTRNRKSLKFKYIEEENRAELVSIDDLPVKLSYGKTEKAFFRKYRIPAWMKKYSFIYRLIQSWISVFFAPKYELYALVRALSAGEEAWQEFVDAHEFQKLVKSIGKKSLKISKVHMDKDQKAMYNYIYYHISEDKSIQLGYKTLLKQIATSSVRQEGENIVALSLYSEFTDSRQEFYKSIIKDFYNDKQNFRFAGGLQKISVISALIKDELSKQEIDASLLSKYKEELIEMTILEDLDLLGQGLLADAFILILDYEKDFKQIKIFKGILNEIAASDDKMARAFSMIALRNQRRRERTRGMVAIKDKVVAALSMITGEMPSAGLTEAIAELSANQSNKLSRHIKAFHRQINASHIRHGFAALMAGYENPLDAEFAELEGGDAVRHTLHNRKMVQSDRELLTLSVEQIKSVTLEELEDIAGRVRAAHDAFIALMLKKEKKRKPGRPSAKDREKRRKAIEEREIAREKYIQVLDELDNALETIDMGVYCIFHLREREGVNEFLNDLMTFCFGQFEVGGERITKEEVEQMVDIIRSSGNFDEAREKLYKSGFRWTEPGNKFYRIFSRKAEIEKPVKYDILKPVILKGGFSEDSVVIDIGCGNHNIAHQLVQDMRNADVPEENIPTFIGTDFAADPGIDDAKIRYIQQDAAEPGTVSIEGEGVADKILISAALHHMPEDVMMSILDEAYRLLKPGGELIIFEDVALYSRKPRFDGGGLAEQVRELYGEEKKVAYTIFDWHANHVMGGNTYVPITGNYHSESEWMDIFSEAGFEVHRKDHIGIYEGRFSALPHSIFVLKKAPEIINVPIGKLVVNAFNANPVRGPVYSAFTEAEKIVNTSSWVEANEPEVADVPLFYVPGNSLDYNDAKTREIIELGMNVIPVLPYSPERTNEGMGDLYNVDFKYNENDYTVQLMVGRVDPSDENSPVAAYFTYEYQDISEAELEGFYEQASFAVIKKIYDDHIVRSEFAKFGVSLNAEKSPIIATKAQELPPYYLGDLVLRESLLTRFIRSDIPAMQYIGTLVYSKAISKTGSVTRPRANSGASFNVSDKASFGNLREYIRLLGEMKANVLLVTELFDESGEMKDLSELGDYVEFANKFDIAVPFEYKWTGQSLEDVKKDIKKAIETYKLNGVRLDLSGYEGDIKSEWLEEIRDLIRNIPANPNVGEVLIVLLPDSQKRAFLGKHCKTIGFSVVKRYVIGMHAKIPAIEKGDCIEIVFPEAAVAEIREGDEADILAGTEQIFTSEAALVIWDFSLLYNGKEILPINENQGIMEMVKGFISGRIEQRPVTQEEHFQIGGRAAWSLSDKYINQIQERLSSDGRTLLTALLQRYIDIVETGSESDIINLVDNRYDFESPFVNSVLAADLAGWIGTDVIKDELANNSQIAGFLWTVMMRIKFNEFKAEYKEAHDQEFLGFNNANYDGFFAYLLLLAETRNIAVPELPVSMPDNMPESISKAREIWQLYYKRLNSLITAGESYERVNSELYAILNRHILSATSGTLTDVDAVAIIHLLMMFADKRRPDFGDIAGESGSQVGNLIFGTEELTGAG